MSRTRHKEKAKRKKLGKYELDGTKTHKNRKRKLTADDQLKEQEYE